MSVTSLAARPFDTAPTRTTLFGALLSAASAHGRKAIALEDPDRAPMSYARLILAALVLGRRLKALTQDGERVGILLPNVSGVAVTIFALGAFGRVPAMLNFTAGAKNLHSACKTGPIVTIVTSRRFVEQAKLDDIVAAIEPGRRVLYLEDIRKEITSVGKLRGIVDLWFSASVHRTHAPRPDDPGVILFTSGTEGAPKGVLLSHANLIANTAQIRLLADTMFSTQDTVFNPLPVFHSFGLTAGLLMGLFNGIKVVLYPSPLHYRQVPKLIGETGATIVFSTDTFLQGYARAAEANDLEKVRFIVAGAERVKDETRRMWAKYGTTILEGYGATECAPVIACNVPADNRPGSVGHLLAGIEARIDPVEGITEGGKFVVRGPNVMVGYLNADRPGVPVPLVDGWHDTGDIVTLEADGMVTIRGRAKRFAKIGGEMVSLAAVESMINELWPGQNHVVINLPDPRKGEQLVLVSEKPDADKAVLQAFARERGFPELWVPKAVMVVPMVPVLGSGKIDFATTVEMVTRMRPLL